MLLPCRESGITSKLSERSIEFADLITERGKILNPEYSIDSDRPTSRASPLRINVLLYDGELIVYSLDSRIGICLRNFVDGIYPKGQGNAITEISNHLVHLNKVASS